MKKKINVVYSVDYETEIEVDTELEEGYYDVEDVLSLDFNYEGEQHEDFIESEVRKLLRNELSDINIPETEDIVYRTGSFTIKSIQV
jgi:hypothetical protein